MYVILTWLLLAHRGLAVVILDTCSTQEVTICQCPTIENNPAPLVPRDSDTCPDNSPPCCVAKDPPALKVSSSTSQTNLQCGDKYGDDQRDVKFQRPGGVSQGLVWNMLLVFLVGTGTMLLMGGWNVYLGLAYGKWSSRTRSDFYSHNRR
ncbi:hypothetical protein MRS44_013214 [Fusarium solani]|uniref:uncharacterized protein n=1 Tax=Fusarium solani TaxID=169388 RepID=UPI0032C495BF|nr:hypothetical protein MRS44_013214 [Fusarium solani]